MPANLPDLRLLNDCSLGAAYIEFLYDLAIVADYRQTGQLPDGIFSIPRPSPLYTSYANAALRSASRNPAERERLELVKLMSREIRQALRQAFDSQWSGHGQLAANAELKFKVDEITQSAKELELELADRLNRSDLREVLDLAPEEANDLYRVALELLSVGIATRMDASLIAESLAN